jgi:hypothetical protein
MSSVCPTTPTKNIALTNRTMPPIADVMVRPCHWVACTAPA